jgi:hypothetical protein
LTSASNATELSAKRDGIGIGRGRRSVEPVTRKLRRPGSGFDAFSALEALQLDIGVGPVGIPWAIWIYGIEDLMQFHREFGKNLWQCWSICV